VLSVDNLSFSHPGGQKLFQNLSFIVNDGAFLAVCGANGSGKSTLLDLLAGLLEPNEGTITLDGAAGANALLAKAALMPEDADHYLLGATVREELTLGLKKGIRDKNLLIGSTASFGSDTFQLKDELEPLASAWKLLEILDRPVEILSSGEKKRLALASALASRPGIFLFDEPFSGLDYPGTVNLLSDLRRLKDEGFKLVVVTHEPALVKELSDLWLLVRPQEYLLTDNTRDLVRLSEFGARPI
jgi:energy-coupling factor transporter ATP-binding protein EcfA2